MKLLLHCCCAPCSCGAVPLFRNEGIAPDLYGYHPNIHPFTEYRSRRDALSQFAKDEGLSLTIEDEYGLRRFLRGITPQDYDEKEGGKRCVFCYRLRLEAAAVFAAENHYDAFSTTLLISPYQNHDMIKAVAGDLAEKHGIPFLYRDLRPGFRPGQRLARERGYYMQKYCGCVFSEEERYCKQFPGTRT
jgi:predicted adenine nucleotide alpha hydrolase (AANH) superfamily ATPase